MHPASSLPIVLTVGGSDSTTGAGIQADLKTFQHLGAYGVSVVTAVTVQNTRGVFATNPLPANLIEAQLDVLANDIRIDVIKIGMLTSGEVVEVVARFIEERSVPVVLDPIIASSNGVRFLEEDALAAFKERLLPLATVLTPNLPEASVLSGLFVRSHGEILDGAIKLREQGAKNILIKGGHSNKSTASDLFYDGENAEWLTALRRPKQVHGTGCLLASAIAVFLAQDLSPRDSVIRAKAYLTLMLDRAQPIGPGQQLFQHTALDEQDFINASPIIESYGRNKLTTVS
jgi:hydroxymethylpyrimidine kinase/phosphomethylpyrimidine kinase